LIIVKKQIEKYLTIFYSMKDTVQVITLKSYKTDCKRTFIENI